MPDSFTDQLSDYLDNELDALRLRRLEGHLTECADCAAVLADLRAITAAAPHYEGSGPARDLWPEIEARLEEPEVLPLRSATSSHLPNGPTAQLPNRSTVRLSWPQLIAAAFLMAAVGGGATWLALRPAPLSNGPTAQMPVKTIAYAEAQYDAAVNDLTLVLEQGRGRLDSATVRVIDESIRKIDAAIAEARAAIQRDSTNVYLNRQIAANMRRKLTLLRKAADAIART